MNPTENSSPASPSAPQGVKPHRLIKLGVDVHLREYVVARQIDGTAPQPAQRFTPEAFVAWAAKQVQQADVVHCCYEAGPFGFGLHRRLLRFGVKNLVVRPRNWDEYGKKVKTDRRDALALVSCLDRFVAGNEAAVKRVQTAQKAATRGADKVVKFLAERGALLYIKNKQGLMPVDMAGESAIVPGRGPRAGHPSTVALLRQLMTAQTAAK